MEDNVSLSSKKGEVMRMKNDIISVVVPIYNVESYLNKCIDSILDQTYTDLDIILVDDGSTDKSGIICDNYLKVDSRIRVFHKKNGGLSDARNYGIKKSKGKYIAFVDGDDYIDKKMYEILYSDIIKFKANISICSKIIEQEDKPEQAHYFNDTILMSRDEALIQLNCLEKYDMSACDKLFERNLFNNIEFPYGCKNEDLYVMYKLFYNSNIITYNPSRLYHYIQRKNSVSISKEKKIDDFYINACLEQRLFFEKNYPKLLYVADTMLVLAYIFQYNKYVNYGIKCPRNILKKYKTFVINNKNLILKNELFSKKRKIQVIMFCYFTFLYYFLLKIKR